MKLLILSFLLFCFPSICAAQELSNAFMHNSESGETAYYDAKTSRERSRLKYTIKKASEKDKAIYELTVEGSGSYGKFQRAAWRQESRMEEKNGLLFILNTSCRASDKDGNIIALNEKAFDYENKKIYWRSKNPDGSLIKELVFPLKEKTTDDISLIYFLKPFAARHNEAGFREFYLITNEPRMYKTKIKFIHEEKFKIDSAEKKAIKLKLTGDIGIIDDILDRYVPHTYIWYEEEKPFDWLQYEGFETSINSAYVRASIVKRDTSAR